MEVNATGVVESSHLKVISKGKPSEIDYKWRFESAVIAYVDLILSCLSLIVLIPCAIGLTFKAVLEPKWLFKNETFHTNFPSLDQHNINLKYALVLVVIYIGLIISCVEIWAANNLRMATIQVRDPTTGLKRTLQWMLSNLIILGVSCILLVVLYSMWALWIWLAIRVVCIIVGYMHMRELRRFAKTFHSNYQTYNATIHEGGSAFPG